MWIFLLMGQSNMAGRGLLGDIEPIRDERIRVLDEGEWHTAKEPLHHDKESAGVGLAMSFAQTLLEREPEASIGFIPCAVGSTPIARWMPGADLYQHAMEHATTASRSGSIKGLLWHQGEHDSQDESIARNYARNLGTMVSSIRDELNDQTLPVVVGGLGTFLVARTDFPHFRTVHAALRALPQTLPHCGFASSAGLTDKGDSLHFDARSLREFGRRYAYAYLELNKEPGACAKPSTT
jgi:hypothetical protein